MSFQSKSKIFFQKWMLIGYIFNHKSASACGDFVLADIFGRLGYMERRGNGFKKAALFQFMLYHLNYGTAAVYKSRGFDGIFGRSNISSITGDSLTAAGKLTGKLKTSNLTVPIKESGKGKNPFVEPQK